MPHTFSPTPPTTLEEVTTTREGTGNPPMEMKSEVNADSTPERHRKKKKKDRSLKRSLSQAMSPLRFSRSSSDHDKFQSNLHDS